jgi:hypothetical protein
MADYTPGDKNSFITAMMPHAMKVGAATGLDPRVIIAQAAQETGWGKHAPNDNFFGIKSHGKGGGANLGTFEYIDGKRVNISDSFRSYDGMGQSVEDYGRFLMENPRYREMLSAPDLEGQIDALGRSGYATDPNYASSVRAIASSIPLDGWEGNLSDYAGGASQGRYQPPGDVVSLSPMSAGGYAGSAAPVGVAVSTPNPNNALRQPERPQLNFAVAGNDVNNFLRQPSMAQYQPMQYTRQNILGGV